MEMMAIPTTDDTNAKNRPTTICNLTLVY